MALVANMSKPTKIVLGAIGLIVLGMVGFAGYTYWDARAHYVAARGQVVWVVDNCTLNRSARKSRRSHEIGPIDCAEARLKQAQGYGGYSVREHRHVGYTFTSPVDGRPHIGTIDAQPGDYPDVRAGSEIEILAHKSDATKSRRPL